MSKRGPALSDFERECILIYKYLNQGEWWKPKEGELVRVEDMGDLWRGNAARWMVRRAKFFETYYSFGETFMMRKPIAREVVGERDGIPVLGRHVTELDLIAESAQDAMSDWQEERGADPEKWIRGTDLYKSLIHYGIADIKVKAAVDDSR